MSLTLQVNGDIEERIEALVSGMCWAEELGFSLEVYWWFLYPQIQCSFERCFSREAFPSWVSIRGGMLETAINVQNERDFIEKGKPLVIKSKRRFYEKNSEKWLEYLRLFRPSHELQHRMNLIPCRGSLSIYIHNNIQPPVAQVLSEIWTKHRTATGFLLSTDCGESKRFLQLMFHNNLYCTNPIAKPFGEKYYLDRALDFFCMSQCSTILDCSQSLLMALSSQYGNISLINL